MATTSILAAAALTLSLLAVGAAARPCKTIFFYTSTTAYYHLQPDSYSKSLTQTLNPNFPLQFQNPRFLTLLLTTTTTARLADEYDSKLGLNRPAFLFPADESEDEPDRLSSSSMIPMELTTSIRDRTSDILSVFVALTLGVFTGIMTGAIVYLIWCVFTGNIFEESDDEFDDADESSPKKIGYVALPGKVVDDDLKKPAPVPAIV